MSKLFFALIPCAAALSLADTVFIDNSMAASNKSDVDEYEERFAIGPYIEFTNIKMDNVNWSYTVNNRKYDIEVNNTYTFGGTGTLPLNNYVGIYAILAYQFLGVSYKDRNLAEAYELQEKMEIEYDGWNVINSYSPEEISISVIKQWVGDNTSPKTTGHRDNVEIHLLADGEDTGLVLILTEENNWMGSFTGLPKYRPEGELIVYTIAEVNVNEYYTSIINGNAEEGFVVTNTHIPTTGDERTAPTLWIGLMAASVVAAGGAAIYVTRRKRAVK